MIIGALPGVHKEQSELAAIEDLQDLFLIHQT